MEEKEAEMVSLSGGKPYSRIAHFLKPSFPISQQYQSSNTNPLPPISPHPTKPFPKKPSSKVQFHGWSPLKDWGIWVDKLLPSFKSTWQKLSIYEAIMSSKCEIPIPKSKDSIFGIAEKWCSETNTFVLPWGEVTITLEDIMVLGGYSVTGESIFAKISSNDLQKIKGNLDMVYMEILKSKAKKVCHYQWKNVWMKKESEFEHEAFLALWLSRYVLPTNSGKTINKNVFSIAILLASGTKIALAPAVLASIYRELRVLKEKIETLQEIGDHADQSVSDLHLNSPLKLLQVWVWERFSRLSPRLNPVTGDLPRLQRWHKVKIPKIADVDLAFDSAVESFRWRPYTRSLSSSSSNGKIYAKEASWVSVTSESLLDLESYARIVRNSKLVGLNCAEQYHPHRVSRQFGLDQDIPYDFPRVQATGQCPWNAYNRPIGDVKLYIPSEVFKAEVTTRYLAWWNKSKGKMEGRDSFDLHQLSLKRSKGSPDPVIDIESIESEASSNASQVKEVRADDDDECYSDHLTLKELFEAKGGTQETNKSGVSSVKHNETPLSSAGNNVCNQKRNLGTKYTENIASNEGCTRKEHIDEDRTEIKTEGQVRSPINIDKRENQTTINGVLESSNIDLLDRIARLQRIIDNVKADKCSQVYMKASF